LRQTKKKKQHTRWPQIKTWRRRRSSSDLTEGPSGSRYFGFCHFSSSASIRVHLQLSSFQPPGSGKGFGTPFAAGRQTVAVCPPPATLGTCDSSAMS
jgi:hypothetical protein